MSMELWEGRDQTDRVVEVLILDVAKFWFWSRQESGEILFFQWRNLWRNLRRNLRACFAHIWAPNNLPPTLHRKFHRVFGRNFSGLSQPSSWEVQGRLSPENSPLAQTQGGVRDREIWKSQDRSGAQFSGTSVSGTWLKKDFAGALSQWACSQNVPELLGLHVMIIIYRCPLCADVAHRNASFLSCINARILKRYGQTGER